MFRILYLFVFVPSILLSNDFMLFQPLTAYQFEPRTSAVYQFDEEKIRLDIGAGFDLFNFTVDSMPSAIGTDFFVMTRLRTESHFKFPVETSDYYFGLHYSLKLPVTVDDANIRLRLAHISSHLVDGYAVNGTFHQNPIIFSREFLELTYAQSNKSIINLGHNLRYYGGIRYIFSTLPKNPNRIVPHIGFDYKYRLSDIIEIKTGYHYELIGISDEWIGTNSAIAGVSLYFNKQYGLFGGLYYFEGRSIHGQFYEQRDSYIGLGIEILYY